MKYICYIRTEKGIGSSSYDTKAEVFDSAEDATAFGEAVSIMTKPLLTSYTVFKEVHPADSIYLYALLREENGKVGEDTPLYLGHIKTDVLTQVEKIKASPFFKGDVRLSIRGYLVPKEELALSEDMDRLYERLKAKEPDICLKDVKEPLGPAEEILKRLLERNKHRKYVPKPTEEVIREICEEARKNAEPLPFDEEDTKYPPSYVCHALLSGREFISDPFATSDLSIAKGYILYAKEDLERRYPGEEVRTFCEVYHLPVLLPSMGSYSQIRHLIKKAPDEVFFT